MHQYRFRHLTYLYHHHFRVSGARFYRTNYFISNVRNNLHCPAEILALAFL